MFINLACLTRYEGWIIILILAGEAAWKAGKQGGGWTSVLREGLKNCAMFGGLPTLWGAAGGVAFYFNEAGAFASQGQSSTLQSITDFIVMLRWQAGDATLIASIVGVWLAYRTVNNRAQMFRLAGLLVVNFPMEILVNPGNLRQPFLFLTVSLIFASIAIAWLIERASQQVARAWGDPRQMAASVGAAMTGLIGLGVGGAMLHASLSFVHNSANEPYLVEGYQIGSWLSNYREPDEPVFVYATNAERLFQVSTYSGIPRNQLHGLDEAGRFYEFLAAISPGDSACAYVAIFDGAAPNPYWPAGAGAHPIPESAISTEVQTVGNANLWKICR